MKRSMTLITMLFIMSSLLGVTYQIGDTISTMEWIESDGIMTHTAKLDSIVNAGKPVVIMWGRTDVSYCLDLSKSLQTMYTSDQFKDKVHIVFASTNGVSLENLNGSSWRTRLTPNPTYFVSAGNSLGSSVMREPFNIQYVPHSVIIGRNRRLLDVFVGGYVIDAISVSLQNALDGYHLSCLNPIQDQILLMTEPKTFDLSNIFHSDQSIQYKVVSNNDSSKVLAKINGGTLTLTPLAVGISKIKIKSWIPGYSAYDEFYVQVTKTGLNMVDLFNEGFETGIPSSWANTGVPSTTWYQTWKLDSLAKRSGSYSVNADRRHFGNIMLTLPSMNLEHGGILEFYWRDNNGNNPAKVVTQDSTFAEISNDDGETWHRLAFLSAQYYERYYSKVLVDLTSFKGNDVKIRFRDWSTGSSSNAVDTNIDDIKISAYTSTDISDEVSKTSMTITNYPNPFNPTTIINYTIKDGFNGLVKLKIYNAKGEVVQTITNNVVNGGHYSQVFNGSKLSSGIYYYGIEAGDFKQMKKMVMVK